MTLMRLPAPQAWEFDVPLRVVALRGSVPAQWAADFRTAAGPRAQLQLQQRPQLQAIYDELGNVEWVLDAYDAPAPAA